MNEGLRERKKQATRRALGEAALRLALEHGPENVRVEEIAAAAGVSTRTYNNYFTSREAAICAVGVERARRLGDSLRARPEDEPLADACVNAYLAHYRGQEDPDREAMLMIFSHPSLHVEFLRDAAAMSGPLVEAIAARCGLDPRTDPFPLLLATTLGNAVRIATLFWLDGDGSHPFIEVLRETLERVAPVAAAYERTR
ncbi:TetR/AcrR family transcriptional regulator [Actinocorallia sp. API 0066]|uniref:TetR/AcrR family transcriptional regulator n=1 Tax=Actinocorallia sp. API 0066 TaxID=2896846 RepID=UPI001E617AA9|nr:TetR/AcrR family transcriptional regulator [Actinocorallia sp. API 0066]MCD0449577.1 TetR/AcrR family transcriptional regulator [Actinocorallia sp. API 0066]